MSLGGSGVSIGGVRILRVSEFFGLILGSGEKKTNASTK